eukprot:5412326-Alexandrium_andersonii.AAC.1
MRWATWQWRPPSWGGGPSPLGSPAGRAQTPHEQSRTFELEAGHPGHTGRSGCVAESEVLHSSA